MRSRTWKIIAAVLLGVYLGGAAHAAGLGGWVDLDYSTTKLYEDDDKKEVRKTFYRNLYLNLEKPITERLSYQLYFRTSLTDYDLTDAEDVTTVSYRRAVEPAMDLFLRNPLYDLSVGYRRQEEWSTAHIRDDSRVTSEYYYSRLNVKPLGLPSLSLQVDRKRDFDYPPSSERDDTNSMYSGNSMYQYSYGGLDLSFSLTFRHSVDETPTEILFESKGDDFNGLYRAAYSRTFRGGTTTFHAAYQGNYVRSKRRQLASETGGILFERIPLGGLHAQGTLAEPEVDFLSPEEALVDGDVLSGISTVNIGTGEYHNIGIRVSSDKSVNRLYVYVDRDVTSDANLTSLSGWKVYKSDSNISGTDWTEIIIQDVKVAAYDAVNNIYRYEIVFLSTENASYFKAVNMNTVDVPGITDVLVTEIEAYGTEVVPETGELTDLTKVFNQGLSLRLNVRPLERLSVNLNYFIDRTDQGALSSLDSVGSLFANILSRTSLGDDEGLTSNVTRTYGVTSAWITHRLLTTTLRIQRNEAFDNRDDVDSSSNTYSLSFSSVPLPTLDTTLSLIRSDRFSFGERLSTNDSVLLSVGARLYRGVNMITDMGYTESKSHAADLTNSTRFVKGSLDAILTRKLTGNVIYGFTWQSSDGPSSDSREGAAVITYRPGRFMNLSASFRATDVDGSTVTSEGALIDWLPVPAVKLNLNYQHSRSDRDSLRSDSLSGYGQWFITRFMDLRLTYNYTRAEREKETEVYRVGANLNCRF